MVANLNICMGLRTGSADIPLHGGRVPQWLADRMSRLSKVIVEAIVLHYGCQEFLRRLAHPFWFQSFGSVLGMDWHSSGITTSVLGALKRGLKDVEWELGIHVCGGRGRYSRQTPSELMAIGERIGLDGFELARTSRLTAKIDSAAIQDGFDLYLHSFIATDDGSWTVVQQGMNPHRRQARRYHWLSENLKSFVDEPHTAIEGHSLGTILNLTDHRARLSRESQVQLIQYPNVVLSTLRKASPRPSAVQQVLPNLILPEHHEVRSENVLLRRLHGTLAAAADRGPRDFAELLLVPGVGARTVQALAFVAEVVHGAPHRFTDPARFSLAHGGKDGHPFPVPLKVYDQTLQVLRNAVQQAKLGNDEKIAAIRRLDSQARQLEPIAEGPSFHEHLAKERRDSWKYAGRTVMGPARHPSIRRTSRHGVGTQLELPGIPRSKFYN